MMLDDQAMQARMVETVYSLSSAGRLSWNQKNKDSYSTKIDTVNVDIDKSSIGDQIAFVLWVFTAGGLASRIEGRSLKVTPTISSSVSYHEILKKIFDLAARDVKARALENALNIVEAYRQSNLPKSDQDSSEGDV